MSSGPSSQHRHEEEKCCNGIVTASSNDKNGLNKIPLSLHDWPDKEESPRSFYSLENPISGLTGSRGVLDRGMKPNLSGPDNELASTVTMRGTVVGVSMAENAV